MIVPSEPTPLIGDLFSLRAWRKIVWRHKFIVLACLVAGVAIAHLLSTVRPRLYAAEAVVALDARKIQVLPTDEVVSRLPQESPVLRTEIDVIGSRSMAARVLERLPADIFGTGEETSEVPAPWQRAHARIADALGRYGVVVPSLSAETPPPEAVDSGAARERIDRLIGGLSVYNDGRSFTIFIGYRSVDPRQAALIANTYAQAYIDQQIELQAAGTRTASDWLGARVDDLRAKLEKSEENVQAFRQRTGLIDVGGTSPQVHLLGALTGELSSAGAARVAAEARLEAARAAAADADSIQNFAEMLQSPVIRDLRAERGDTVRELTGLREAGATRSARIPALENRLASLDKAIGEEVGRLIDSLQHEVVVATRKEDELSAAVADLERQLAQDGASLVELNRMEREVGANRVVYESFLARYKESIEQQGLALPEARVISWAEPPARPISSRLPMMVIGVLFGLGSGLSIAFAQDRLDTRIRNAGLLEQRTELPVLAVVPRCRQTLFLPPQMHPVTRPASPFSVAVRKLCTALRLAPGPTTGMTILVTSAGPAEGKTTLAVSIARSYALAGESVVLVDGDLAAPEVAAAVGLQEVRGQLDLIVESLPAGLDQLVSRDPWTPLSVVPLARGTRDTGYLFRSPEFHQFIQQLARRYSIVVIDGPAVSRSADAAVLARLADTTIVCAKWGATQEADVVTAIRHLVQCGIAVEGLVITSVDPGAVAETEAGPVQIRTGQSAARAGHLSNGSALEGIGPGYHNGNGSRPGAQLDA